jgi:hypothetical protein
MIQRVQSANAAYITNPYGGNVSVGSGSSGSSGGSGSGSGSEGSSINGNYSKNSINKPGATTGNTSI